MKISSLAVLVGVSALAALGCVDREAQKRAGQTQAIVTNPVTVVTVQPLKLQTVSEKLELTGQVVTADDSQVSAKQSGRLIEVLVHDGDRVAANQVIARQDSSQLQAQYRQALAGVATAQSQLAEAISNARLSPTKSSAAVRQAQAQVASSKQALLSAQAQLNKVKAGARPEERLQADAAVRSAKASLDKAKKDLQRITQLVAQGASAASELDAAQTTYESALSNYETALQSQAIQKNGARSEDIAIAQAGVDQARDGVRQSQEALRAARASQGLDVMLFDAVRTAQAQVAAARAQADAARVAIQDTIIRSPFSGIIAGRPLQAGAMASSGTTIARIVGAQGAYFEGQVPEDKVRLISQGRPVEVMIDALPGRTFSGRVVAISGLGSSVGRQFAVRIGLQGSLSEIRPGVFARGEVLVRTVPSATVVPASAIVRKNNQDVVFLAQKDKAHAVPVVRGIADGDIVQVVGAVKQGDPIVIEGQTTLDDGAKIRIEDKAKGA